MIPIKDRLKEFRKSLNMTQEEFATDLNCGVSRNQYAHYELGRVTVPEWLVQTIAQKYGVDEHWLRTGEGEMFRPKDKEEEVFSWVGSVLGKPDDDIRKKLLTTFASVPEDKWELLEEFVKSLQK